MKIGMQIRTIIIDECGTVYKPDNILDLCIVFHNLFFQFDLRANGQIHLMSYLNLNSDLLKDLSDGSHILVLLIPYLS